MRINIHDKFKSWRHFIRVAKTLYRFFDKHNVEVSSIVAYVSLVSKMTGKSTNLEICNEELGRKSDVGIDIGYFEWADAREIDGMKVFANYEEDLLNQHDYRRKRYLASRENCEKVKREEFEIKYLPVMSCLKSGRKRVVYKTINEMERAKVNWKYVKRAIDNDKEYQSRRWSKVESR